MKLQQLRCIVAMMQNNLNVSETAAALYTSQPGVSKQIRALEDEIGVELFERSGRQIVSVTNAGRDIIPVAEKILAGTEDIRNLGRQHADPYSGELRLATTHTQARYVLPAIINAFGERYPRVNIHLHQGTPVQMVTMVETGEVDFVIATEGQHLYENLVMLPCSRWNRAVIVKPDHALYKLAQLGSLTLEALANFPIITYVFGFTGRSQLDRAFTARDLKPNVVLTATDADVIKTYVRSGLGVGIIARMAYEPEFDSDLKVLDAAHLFECSTTHIGMRQHRELRPFMYEFIEQFAPHLTRDLVDAALASPSRNSRERLFETIELPND
ncbi:MAG: HTH-type transcriptional regulator CysB [Granulosicoccus sp.]